jgi:adenine-specific DNA methylase
MIPKECKRLIEVDFPIAAVSAHSAREKSIRHGHPSTLHLWWARRPLAACRAVLLGLLLPDPCQPPCPADFKKRARELLPPVAGTIGPSDDDLQRALLKFIGDFANWDFAANQTFLEIGRGLVKAAHPEETPVVVDPFAGGGSIPLEALRLGCEAFASDLNPVACLILKTLLEDIPRYGNAEFKLKDDLPDGRQGKFYTYVLRCNDGSHYKGHTEDLQRRITQHEAGECEWTSKHLPVELLYYETFDTREEAVEREKYFKSGSGREWLQKKLKDVAPPAVRQVHGLADALRHVGKQVKHAAEKELAKYYPADADGSRPIAYLWARTVRCEAVGCGAEIPLMKSFWLCNKTGRRRALRFTVERPKKGAPFLTFEIYAPKSESTVSNATVHRADATCPCCHIVLPAARVRSQLAQQRGGADVQFGSKGNRIGGATLLAVVTLRDDTMGRFYRLPTSKDYAVVYAAQKAVAKLAKGVVPDESTPKGGGRGAGRAFGIQNYGMMQWGDLFTARQKLAMVKLGEAASDLSTSDGIQDLLALAIDKTADLGNALAPWKPDAECPVHLLARQAIGVAWDWAESVPICDASGSFTSAYERTATTVEATYFTAKPIAGLQIADACKSPLLSDSCSVWFTDPPYYDAVPYSDLSDFFYAWLRRTLPKHPLMRDPFDSKNPLTPKAAEIVQDETRRVKDGVKDRSFFEREMARAFAEGRRVMRDDGLSCVVFAHKTTEGWEALLTGMLRAGWAITASWPITTESGSRLRARDSAALAASVHLVCRPRDANAGVGDWSDVKAAMEKRIREWLPTLTKHGVRGADAIFSCLGPALESYSRYEKVLTSADREVPLGGDPEASEPHERGFLAYVFETLSKEALRQVLGLPAEASAQAGDVSTEGYEEDARLTALFLWTLQTTKANGNPDRIGAGGEKAAVVAEDAEDEGDEENALSADRQAKKPVGGLSMPFDTFIRITRPMGIHYPALEGRVIEIEKGVVRLLPVKERMEELLGEAAKRGGAEFSIQDLRQGELFARGATKSERPEKASAKSPKLDAGKTRAEGELTTLDRIHRAMLLFGLGRSALLRQVLEAELRQGKRFERLALSLNQLYYWVAPDGDERRMLEGVQAAMRGVK